MSIRAVTRVTGLSKTTVSKLVVDAGQAAAWYQDRVFQSLTCKRLQVDEIWGFVAAKQKNVGAMKRPQPDAGDAWLWLATDADTKLVPCWHVGNRSGDAAMEFIDDLASRLANRVQLTTDGHKAYLYAVDAAFGGEVDYAQLVKLYGAAPESAKGRYSPAECTGIVKTRVIWRPRYEARQHVLRGAQQSQHPDALAPHDAPDKRLLKEDGKPRARDGAPLPLLQFRSHP